MPRYIDADALMKVIREHDYPLRSHFNSTDNGMFTIGIQQAVDGAPTADVVPVVRGEWIPKTGRAMCSVCADECWADSALEYAYCPNCGAKMESEGGT